MPRACTQLTSALLRACSLKIASAARQARAYTHPHTPAIASAFKFAASSALLAMWLAVERCSWACRPTVAMAARGKGGCCCARGRRPAGLRHKGVAPDWECGSHGKHGGKSDERVHPL